MRERITLWFFHNVMLRIFGIWYGRHLSKIRDNGEFGRKHRPPNLEG